MDCHKTGLFFLAQKIFAFQSVLKESPWSVLVKRYSIRIRPWMLVVVVVTRTCFLYKCTNNWILYNKSFILIARFGFLSGLNPRWGRGYNLGSIIEIFAFKKISNDYCLTDCFYSTLIKTRKQSYSKLSNSKFRADFGDHFFVNFQLSVYWIFLWIIRIATKHTASCQTSIFEPRT